MKITPQQCRMARAALQIGVRALADKAKVSPGTVSRFEAGQGEAITATVAAIRRALEAEGIIFTENGVETTPRA